MKNEHGLRKITIKIIEYSTVHQKLSFDTIMKGIGTINKQYIHVQRNS